ncbi:Serpin B6 [Clonorchis sinensis]|uniref:Serpin B6 n=1 Tax=Clonorchis sinensis TaxID=79923 RepID=A0A3R7EUE7_CLOSI|nr:Serpin B6 [Clonorchis sinensis]
MEDVLCFKEGLTEFATEIYDKIIKLQAANLTNSVFSPMSIYCASLLVMAGADGETLQEIQQVLHIPPKLRSDAVHQSYGPIISKYFEASSDVDLNLANRLFLLKSIDIRPEYSSQVAMCYKALVELLTGLPDVESRRCHINAWVAENTKDKIRELLPRGFLDQNSKFLLIDALYFRGSWDHQFDKEQTQESDFHCLNGESTKVQMMYRESSLYLSDLVELDCTGIKLPFRRSAFQGEWALLILLPHERAGLQKLISQLRAPGKLASAMGSKFHMENAHLYLPKFKLADEPMIDLKPILYECGMTELFDGRGNLSRLSQSCLSMTEAYHKAVLELDEEGVTAAAATTIVVDSIFPLHKTISVDHPFFFALVCDSTMPVFVGHVVAPKFD